MKGIDRLISVTSANPKYNGFFQEASWKYYIDGIQDEIKEVEEEISGTDRSEYHLLPNGVTKLEDELGDVLWDCLSLIEKLNYEGIIDKDQICEHTRNKFLERMPYIRDKEFKDKDQIIKDSNWEIVKKLQKDRGIIPQNTKL